MSAAEILLLVFGLSIAARASAAAVFPQVASVLLPPVTPATIRSDSAGDGHFGASRGSRSHEGLDLIVTRGQLIHSPISGTLNRYAYPYATDLRWKGVEITGTGDDAGYVVKMFYMDPALPAGTTVQRGTVVGNAQAISQKYTSAMRDHLHVEVRHGGLLVDPEPLFFSPEPPIA